MLIMSEGEPSCLADMAYGIGCSLGPCSDEIYLACIAGPAKPLQPSSAANKQQPAQIAAPQKTAKATAPAANVPGAKASCTTKQVMHRLLFKSHRKCAAHNIGLCHFGNKKLLCDSNEFLTGQPWREQKYGWL